MKLTTAQTTALLNTGYTEGSAIPGRETTLNVLVRHGLARWVERRAHELRGPGSSNYKAVLTDTGRNERRKLHTAQLRAQGATGPRESEIQGNPATATHVLRVYRHWAMAPGNLDDRTPDRIVYVTSTGNRELSREVDAYGIPGSAWKGPEHGRYGYSGETYTWGPITTPQDPQEAEEAAEIKISNFRASSRTAAVAVDLAEEDVTDPAAHQLPTACAWWTAIHTTLDRAAKGWPQYSITTEQLTAAYDAIDRGQEPPATTPAPVSIYATTADGERIEYAHIPNGNPQRVALFLDDARNTPHFSNISTTR